MRKQKSASSKELGDLPQPMKDPNPLDVVLHFGSSGAYNWLPNTQKKSLDSQVHVAYAVGLATTLNGHGQCSRSLGAKEPARGITSLVFRGVAGLSRCKRCQS